jgi:hypothetical protein
MGGGAAAAVNPLKTPDDLLTYMEAHPDQVAIAAYPAGHPQAGVYHRADSPQSLASTVKILVLYDYARQVAEGALDPKERVSVDDVFAHGVGRDGGAAKHALDDWQKRGVLDQAGNVPLDEVAHAMIRFSCNASTDYLIARVGRKNLDALPARLGLTREEAPFPLSGCTLMVGNHTTTGAPSQRLAAYGKMSRAQVVSAAYEWNQRLRTEPSFQNKEIQWLQAGGWSLSAEDQQRFFAITNPRRATMRVIRSRSWT